MMLLGIWVLGFHALSVQSSMVHEWKSVHAAEKRAYQEPPFGSAQQTLLIKRHMTNVVTLKVVPLTYADVCILAADFVYRGGSTVNSTFALGMSSQLSGSRLTWLDVKHY